VGGVVLKRAVEALDHGRAKTPGGGRRLGHQFAGESRALLFKEPTGAEGITALGAGSDRAHQGRGLAHALAGEHGAVVGDQVVLNRTGQLAADEHGVAAGGEEQQEKRQETEVEAGAEHRGNAGCERSPSF